MWPFFLPQNTHGYGLITGSLGQCPRIRRKPCHNLDSLEELCRHLQYHSNMSCTLRWITIASTVVNLCRYNFTHNYPAILDILCEHINKLVCKELGGNKNYYYLRQSETPEDRLGYNFEIGITYWPSCQPTKSRKDFKVVQLKIIYQFLGEIEFYYDDIACKNSIYQTWNIDQFGLWDVVNLLKVLSFTKNNLKMLWDFINSC